MYCFATHLGIDVARNDLYDAVVWPSEEEACNDDGARAIARQIVAVPCDAPDIAGVVRDVLGLGDLDDVELN